MNEVTITAAPQAYLSDDLYEEWMESHTGTKDSFLLFMTTPSVERSLFLDSLVCETDIREGIGTATYSANKWQTETPT